MILKYDQLEFFFKFQTNLGKNASLLNQFSMRKGRKSKEALFSKNNHCYYHFNTTKLIFEKNQTGLKSYLMQEDFLESQGQNQTFIKNIEELKELSLGEFL